MEFIIYYKSSVIRYSNKYKNIGYYLIKIQNLIEIFEEKFLNA